MGHLRRIPLESEEELNLIKRYMLLPVLMDVLERDLHTIQAARLKLPGPHVRSLRAAERTVHREEADIRARFRTSGIRIYAQRRTAEGIEAEYLCRGYRRRMMLLWSHIRAEAEELLQRYMGLADSNKDKREMEGQRKKDEHM